MVKFPWIVSFCGKISGGFTMSITPPKSKRQRQPFRSPIFIRKNISENRTVKRGEENINVRASPRGRKARHLKVRYCPRSVRLKTPPCAFKRPMHFYRHDRLTIITSRCIVGS